MKIALITKEFVPGRGGAERYSEGLARTMVAHGHEVHVFTTRFGGQLPPGLIPHCLAKSVHLRAKIAKAVAQSPCEIIYAIAQHYPAHLYRAGDGVHAHWMRLKHPHVAGRLLATLMPKRWQAAALEKKIYDPKNCQAIITNSRLVQGHITQYYPFPAQNIHVVYNGVDRRLFCPGSAESRRQWCQEQGVVAEKMLILFVAHNWERKGLATLLQGAARLLRAKAAELVVIGRGKPKQWQPLMRKLGIAGGVRFLGPTLQMTPWYQAAQVMVLPTQYDPFANVCLEAMACAVPVITTLENGASEIIRAGENGYLLTTPYNWQEIESQLERLQNRSLQQTMAAHALTTSQAFTLERNTQETLSICAGLRS